MKSTLSITVTEVSDSGASHRTIEVPCRLPEAFNFKFAGKTFTALLSGKSWADVIVSSVETENDGSISPFDILDVDATAESILATIKATLGITGPVPPGSPLPAIALAYEAEVAAYEAAVKANRELPRVLAGDVIYWSNPADGHTPSCRMLAKYVEHVVEQAAKEVK